MITAEVDQILTPLRLGKPIKYSKLYYNLRNLLLGFERTVSDTSIWLYESWEHPLFA